MFSHVMVGTRDLDRASAFYDAVLAPLGIERVAFRRKTGGKETLLLIWPQPRIAA